MTERIAFLGLGAMGARMAARLIAAGHGLTVWNRSPARAEPLAALGARVAPTPRAAAAGAGIVVAMVRDDDASKALWLDTDQGALAAMAPGTLAVECSTLTIGHVEMLAAAAGGAGVALVAAPLAGSRPQAEAGQLIFLASGDAVAIDTVEPVLLAMGQAVHRIGARPGDGPLMKLMVNMLFGVQVAAMVEVLALGQAHGLDRAESAALLARLPVTSPAAGAAGAAIAARAFAPQFPIDLVAKDFAAALEAAVEGGIALPLTAATHRRFAEAAAAGIGDLNITGIARLLEREAGRA